MSLGVPLARALRSLWPMRRLALIVLTLASCADAGDEWAATTTSPAPLVGVDGSADSADRNCHVVLRELTRPRTGPSWETAGSSWVWAGTIEISETAAAEGLEPALTYQSGSDPTWRVVDAEPMQAAATPGFVRYSIRIAQGLPGPGMSGTSIANSRIHAVPFLRLAAGGRLFDHNRNAGDNDNYVITSPDFAIARKDSVCAPPAGPNRARLVFDADWTEHRDGVLAPGGEVSIVYAQSRLAQCYHSRAGNPLWDITARVQFSPGGQVLTGSVRDGAWTLGVPSDARSAAVWFEATSASGCHQWDSNLGANYVFDAATPPQWVGNGSVLLTRATGGDICNGSAIGGFAFDTWTRTRAAITNLCFEVYQPGLTDRDDADLWQKLDVSLRYRYAGSQSWESRAVDFSSRIGNNARYVMSLRDVDPFRPYQCPTAALTRTADGLYDQTTVEYYVVVNGYELRPQPGAAFTGTFIDYAGDHYCN
jgi:Family of unknown function (DUF6209)